MLCKFAFGAAQLKSVETVGVALDFGWNTTVGQLAEKCRGFIKERIKSSDKCKSRWQIGEIFGKGRGSVPVWGS